MIHLLAVGLGGFMGSIARYLVNTWVLKTTVLQFPLATLIVNVTGCLMIGIIMTLAQENTSISTGTRLFLVTGILGGFTTFSAFGFETTELMIGGRFLYATLNILANTLIGILAVLAGRFTVRLFHM